ncbi:polymorphic toxin type 15 domain-containing protein [Fibrella sp. WM1]|uniref:polymorphic toxin type 15 domain-containing protein n=1 Tax=Fibrella musci TaxID=3242485 RepID=UPI00352098CA
MEYKLILSGPVNKRTVENAVIDWVRKHPQGVMATSGSRGLTSQSMPVPQNRQQQAPAHSPALAPQRTQTRVYGPPAPAGLEQALSSHIRMRRISEMGKSQVHTFIYNERELLIVRQGNLHHQWVQLKHSWETTQGLQAVQAVQPNPANLSEWDRLKLAMASGIRQLPGQVVETVQKIIDSLLTWQGMLLIVAVTAIFVLGGEIALILMGAVAVYDLLMNVLPLLVEFYHKAIAAKDQAEIDAAGKLFAQAILRGGLDVIDILFAGGAVRRLTVLGGGRITARAVWVYLEERIGLLVARLQKGAGKLQRIIQEAQEAARKGKALPLRRLSKYRTRPPFERNPNHPQAEYDRQIQAQQDGLNDMTVEEYLNNSDRYKAQGRAGDKAQREARSEAARQKYEELRRQGKSPQDAKQESEAWMRTQAALHNPDQIAGGNPDHIGGMGDSNVNSSIGSQWKNKRIAENMDAHIRQEATRMTPEQRRTTKLNIDLDH